MEMKYKFGQVQVTCEGFDYPEDPYILAGSCGLEYTIDRVGSTGSTSYGSSNNGGTSFWSSSDTSEEGSWALFIIIGFVIFLLVTNLNSSSDERPPPYNPDFIPPAGSNPNTGWFSGPGRTSSSSSDGPGFGTGFAVLATGTTAFAMYIGKLTNTKEWHEIMLDYCHHKRTQYGPMPLDKMANGILRFLRVMPK